MVGVRDSNLLESACYVTSKYVEHSGKPRYSYSVYSGGIHIQISPLFLASEYDIFFQYETTIAG